MSQNQKNAVNEMLIRNVDYIMVVNKDFEIVYNSRWDGNMGNGTKSFFSLHKEKKLFDSYPTLGKRNSTIARTMATGEVIISDAQEFSDSEGKVYVTQNMTFPVYKDGKIAGAVELTKELTNVEHVRGKEAFFHSLAMENSFQPNRENDERITFDDILTLDEEMLNTIERAKIFSTHMSPTLIYGETGTGKELFAQAMINYGANPKQKIIVQNCAAVPENLIESILFGTTKGSFTGAENKKGLFEEADGGIFFLDELNALPYGVQGKLLRVVQDGTFRPIGSSREKKVNVKLIAAMNIDPMVAIENNVLRKDLFYRLSSNMIYLPPLRERKHDIEYLTDHYIEMYNQLYHKSVSGISESLREVLLRYSWEGNVRELKHVIESMVSMSKHDVLEVDEIPLYLHNRMQEEDKVGKEDADVRAQKERHQEESEHQPLFELEDGEYDLKQALEGVEKNLILTTLRKVNGNKTKASKLLGIPRQTLNYKMAKWKLQEDETTDN